jgi:hypothetical protein
LRVQLLNNSGGKVKEVVAHKNVVRFDYVTPGKYYVSAFVDANNNGLWDTGNYNEDLQAEAVYYYSRMIECKEKWDVTQSWDLTSVPRFRQKPQEIVKQKPEAQKKQQNRNAQRASDLGITYTTNKTIKIEKEK